MSAVINRKLKPLRMRRMIAVAAVMATVAFASVFYYLNYLIAAT